MRVRWTPTARRQREDQLAFIQARNRQAAVNMGEAVRAAARLLAGHPLLGRIGRVPQTREYAVPGTPYLLVYFVRADSVVIVRLLHTSQDYP